MNQYSVILSSFREQLNNIKYDQSKVKSDLKAYSFLISCETNDIESMFDTGVFNDIIAGYFYKAVDDVQDLTDKQKDQISEAFNRNLSEMTANEANKYLNEN